MKKRQIERSKVPYKLVIGRMMSGLPSDFSSIMILPLGQRMGPGAIAPQFICSTVIQLQAVVEIITSETARALNILAKQHTKVCNAIYQNCLALTYLLASEGGV
jgi:hypothetical protein